MTIPLGIVSASDTFGHIWDEETVIDPIEDGRLLAAEAEEPVATGIVVEAELDADPAAEPATVEAPNSATVARATTEAVATEAAAAHHRRGASRNDAHLETNLLAVLAMTITLPLWDPTSPKRAVL
jgi:hypothetical protein